jgi:regulator of RNase E activity RraA
VPTNGVTTDVLSLLKEFDSATLANAIDSLGERDPTDGFASAELKCMFPDLPPVIGYAVTCTYDGTTPGKRPSADRQLYEAIAASPKPCVVVLQDIGINRLRSNHLGDVMASTFQTLGCVAAVSDGCARDLPGMKKRAPGFQVFAAGVVPGGGMSRIVEVGVTVSIFGLLIKPGDLLHGDANGLLGIPADAAERAAIEARKIVDNEEKKIAFIRSPEFSVDALGARSGW